MNLFNIESKHIELLSRIEEAEGVVSDELLTQFEESREELNNKLNAYQYRIKTLQAEAKALKDEAKRLQDNAKTRLASIDRLKRIVAETISRHGEQTKAGNYKLDTGKFKISTTVSKQLHIADGAELPEQYLTTKTMTTVNKTALKKALESEETVEGVTLIINKSIKSV